MVKIIPFMNIIFLSALGGCNQQYCPLKENMYARSSVDPFLFPQDDISLKELIISLNSVEKCVSNNPYRGNILYHPRFVSVRRAGSGKLLVFNMDGISDKEISFLVKNGNVIASYDY